MAFWKRKRPDPTAPDQAYVELVSWLHTQFTGHHVESRVHDAGWAWWINTQPDEYLDGNHLAMTYGNGPWLVIKRDNSVWYLKSDPSSVPLYRATGEEEFYDIWRRNRSDTPMPNYWIPRF